MTKLFRVAFLSLAVIAGASSAQAGGASSSTDYQFNAEKYFEQFDLQGWG